jgi:hypothetical protein
MGFYILKSNMLVALHIAYYYLFLEVPWDYLDLIWRLTTQNGVRKFHIGLRGVFECPRGTKYQAYVLAHRGNTSVRVPVL